MRRSEPTGARCLASSSTPSPISIWSFLSICAEVSAEAKLAKSAEPERCRWVHVRDLHGAALPSVMRKVLAHALE